MIPVRITWMHNAHLAEVLAIDRAGYPEPWSEDDYRRLLRQPNVIGMVALDGDRVLGAMVYQLHRQKLHLLRLAALPLARREGVGRQMVEKLHAKLTLKRPLLTVDLDEGNLGAHLFCRACGLRAVGVLRKHDPETGADAYHFVGVWGDSQTALSPERSES